MEEKKDIFDTLDNYLINLYENEEQIDDNHKFACIYGLIYIFKKIKELNLPLGIDFSFIFVTKEGLSTTINETIKKIKEENEKLKDENNDNFNQFIIMSWNILKNEEINDNPFIKKDNKIQKVRKKNLENYNDILEELDKLILSKNLESIEKLIENKLNKEGELLDRVIVNLNDEDEIEEENEEESEKDDNDDENEKSNNPSEIEENEDNNNNINNNEESKLENIINDFKQIIKSDNNEDLNFFDKYKNFFDEKNFILTEKSKERLLLLKKLIELKIPVLLEGPTGASKTLSAEIICELLLKEKGEINEKKLPIKFNLSSETRIPDLLGKYVGSKSSFGGMKMKDGPFIDAYKNGRILILDEINLASKTVLQCIGEAIDNNFLSIDISGRPLKKKIYKKKGFSIIATQNPNTGFYSQKRQNLGKEFLSRFQIIYFPSFTEFELKQIALGLGKRFNLKINLSKININYELFIDDFIKFHIEWLKKVENEIICFTIREIAATIKALSPDEKRDKNKIITTDIYNTIMIIYGARYPKQKKNELENVFNKYESFKLL